MKVNRPKKQGTDIRHGPGTALRAEELYIFISRVRFKVIQFQAVPYLSFRSYNTRAASTSRLTFVHPLSRLSADYRCLEGITSSVPQDGLLPKTLGTSRDVNWL